jgi:hypothetical protein
MNSASIVIDPMFWVNYRPICNKGAQLLTQIPYQMGFLSNGFILTPQRQGTPPNGQGPTNS